jgi:riboflavin biosynthesis pyrimidine reductase
VSVAAVRTPAEYENRLQRYLFERSEEGRAVRVGEKEVSEQAAIVGRYGDLFSRAQLEALRDAEAAASGEERERLYRLRKTCEGGLVTAELAERDDALENAVLAARLTFKGEEMPLRTAQARLAVLDSYRDRDELGAIQAGASAVFNPERLGLVRATAELEADLSGEPDHVRRSEEEKGVSLDELEQALAAAGAASAERWQTLRDRWFERLLGPDREELPASSHVSYMRRLSPLDRIYTKERAVEICLTTLDRLGFALAGERNIRLDLDDRPQKSPRACVIASDPPAVVHLITRAQGGLHDYQAFLHEAGHALHYAGCDPALPYTFRRIARDHALTEIYSYILEAISREPGWHAEHFGLADEQAAENAEATTFLEALLFRRYTAKLQFELDFWSRFDEDGGTPDGYSERLTTATGIRYRSDAYLSDMDAGFYSADYLRAWIRSAQLRAFLLREVGEDWWRRAETGDHLRALFREGTRPSSEELAARLGFEPLDTGPLLEDLA